MRFLHKKSFPTFTHSTFIRNPSFGLAYKLTVFFGQSDTLNKLKTATWSVKEKILRQLSLAIEAFLFHYLQHGSSNTFFLW